MISMGSSGWRCELIDHQTLRHVVGYIEEVGSSEALTPFDAIGRAIGATYTLLFAESIADGEVKNPRVEGVDQDYGRRLQHAAKEGLLPGWLHKIKPGQVVDRAAFQRDNDFVHSEFFNYVVRPEGRFHCLITTLYSTPTQRYHLILGRPFARVDFTPTDIAMLKTLMPFVSRMIMQENDVIAARDQVHSLTSAFDRVSANVLIVELDGRVAFANLGAQRLLALRDGLLVCHGVLTTAEPGATATLRLAILQATAIGEVSEVAFSLPRPSGCPPLQVTVACLPQVGALDVHNGLAAPRAMLVVQQPDPGSLVEGWFADRAWGLTAKELEVAIALTRGHALRDVAATLGIGYNTARSHLRHVFEKTHTHRQTDLIRKILNASPRLRL